MAILLPILVGVSGCVSPTPNQGPIDDAPEDTAPIKIDPVLLNQLLDKAEQALAADHYAYPAEGSAYQTFSDILAIQPDQPDALHGYERIVEHYVDLSMAALNRDQFARARSMLARARIIIPNHPSIKPTDEQIRLLSQAQRTTIKLHQDDIKSSSQDLRAELRALANTSAEQSCRYLISAKNDAQGRWIYQSLAKGAAQRRIRAQIEIRLPAAVERLCFPS